MVACPVCRRDMADDPVLCPDCMTAKPQSGWPSPDVPPPPTEMPPPSAAATPAARRASIRCPNPSCLAKVPTDTGQCIYCGTTLGGSRPAGWVLEIEGVRVPVAPGRALLIGRVDESPFVSVLAGRDNVSRRHCEVRGGEVLQVRDLDSTNGTFVDDRRVGPAWTDVPSGSRLRLASNVVVRLGAGAGP